MCWEYSSSEGFFFIFLAPARCEKINRECRFGVLGKGIGMNLSLVLMDTSALRELRTWVQIVCAACSGSV